MPKPLPAACAKACKPHQWKKGESGNRKGRPRKARTMTEALQQLIDEYEKLKGKDDDGNPEKGLPHKLVKKVIDDALASGDPKRIEMVWDRLDGAVTKEAKIHIEVQSTVQGYLELVEPVIKEWFAELVEQQKTQLCDWLSEHQLHTTDEQLDRLLSRFSTDVYPKGDAARWLNKSIALAWADHEETKRTSQAVVGGLH